VVDTLSTVSLNSEKRAQLQNKEYLIAVFRYWHLSCKQFLPEHFAEKRHDSITYACKIVVLKLCAFFFWNTLYVANYVTCDRIATESVRAAMLQLS